MIGLRSAGVVRGPFRINYASPQARQLGAWFVSDRPPFMREMVMGLVPSASTSYPAWFGSDQRGAAADFIAASSQYFFWDGFIGGVGQRNATITAWVRVPTTSEKGAWVKVGSHPSIGHNGYGFGVGSGDVDTAGNEFIGLFENIRWIPTGVSVGTGWKHVAMVLSPDSPTIPSFYLDGRLVATASSGDPGDPASIKGTFIGGYNLSSRFSTSRVDDVRLYQRALSAEEIWQLYDPATRWDLYQPSRLNMYWDLGAGAAPPPGGGAIIQNLMIG